MSLTKIDNNNNNNNMRCHAVIHVENPTYFSPCKYKVTRDETWEQDPVTWNSLHDARFSHGSMHAVQFMRTITDTTSITI